MKKVYNLTQHQSLPEQQAQGVVDLAPEVRQSLRSLLTFDDPPTQDGLLERAIKVADLLPLGAEAAMIGGAPYLMPVLVDELRKRGVTPTFAFSKRVSEDNIKPDGTCQKVSVFKHICLILAASAPSKTPRRRPACEQKSSSMVS